MIVDKEKIAQAKEKLGDQNAVLMAQMLDLQKFDAKNFKGLCPYHDEDTPSFVYNKKNYTYHCFGCGKTVDIVRSNDATRKNFYRSGSKFIPRSRC